MSGPATQPGLLPAVAGIAGLLAMGALALAGAWLYARDDIAASRSRHALATIAPLLATVRYDNQPQEDVIHLDTGAGAPLPVYRARRAGAPVAAVLTVVAPAGYGGPIRLLVGIAADGRVTGVRVATHAETPGVGSVVADEPSAWREGFTGRGAGQPPPAGWALHSEGGDFDAIAGATVSSRAVVGGVHGAVQYFAAHRARIFATPGESTRP